VLVPTLGAALIHAASFVLVLLILLVMGRVQMGPGVHSIALAGLRA
jgi:hypothetical protein